MADTDHKTDDVLRRMLATKPKPHKPAKEKLDGQRKAGDKASRAGDDGRT